MTTRILEFVRIAAMLIGVTAAALSPWPVMFAIIAATTAVAIGLYELETHNATKETTA